MKAVSIREAARMLDDSEHEVREMLKVGILEPVDLGDGRLRVSAASVEKMKALYEADKASPFSQLLADMAEAYPEPESVEHLISSR